MPAAEDLWASPTEIPNINWLESEDGVNRCYACEEENLPNFHFYDIDMVESSGETAVLPDCLLKECIKCRARTHVMKQFEADVPPTVILDIETRLSQGFLVPEKEEMRLKLRQRLKDWFTGWTTQMEASRRHKVPQEVTLDCRSPSDL